MAVEHVYVWNNGQSEVGLWAHADRLPCDIVGHNGALMLPDSTVAHFLQETAPLDWYEKGNRLMEFYQEHMPGYYMRCEFSGIYTPNLDRHHCLLNAEKKYRHITDTVINLAFLEHDPHIARVADNNDFREKWLFGSDDEPWRIPKVEIWPKWAWEEWIATWPPKWWQTRRPIVNLAERILG